MGVPKPTEMTIRNFLLKELEKRGVKVDTEISYTTPIGRLMPDMLLHNGAQYVVETKLGAETKLLDAMVRLYDYSKYTQAKGAFAVLFPKELRQPWNIEILEKIAKDPKLEYIATAIFKDLRPSQRFAGNLSQIADWMADQVLRPLVVEADTNFAIKVLTEAVQSINASVRMLREEELEDIFGGKTVFENILQYEEGRYPLDEMRQAATYLLVNQIIFYHVLSRMDAAFTAIDEGKIGKPADLQRYFEPVLKRDYTTVFGFDVASRLPESANDVVKNVIMAVKALAPEKIAHDVLGKVFHELIPFSIRKAVAAFYTNNEAAEILAQLAIDKPDAKVIDLAVGSGTLLVAAYRRKRDLLRRTKGTFELPEDHKRFLEQDLTGIDIMPFAAHLAVMHLSLQALLSETEKVRVAVWDSTELKPGLDIPAIYSELKAAYKKPTLDMFKKGAPKGAHIKKGAITLEGVGGERISLEQVDIVIMNPPFTRQQRIPREYKQVFTKRFSDLNQYLHGQMGYHGYFILLAHRFLKNEGRLALVLPATVLNADGFLKIRELLTSSYHIEHIITTWQRSAFSEGAQFREILLVAKKKEHGSSDEDVCVVSELKQLPQTLEEAKEFADKIRKIVKRKAQGLVYEDKTMQVTLFTMEQLRNSVDNLFKFIAFVDKELVKTWELIVSKSTDRLVEFGEYIEQYGVGPKEGAALGQILKGGGIGAFYIHRDPAKMLKKKDVWLLKEVRKNRVIVEHKALQETYSIPTKALRCAIRRFSGLDSFDISRQFDYIIVDAFPEVENVLQLSLGRKVSRSHLKKWNRYVDNLLGNLLFVNHVDVSAPGTSILAYYSSKPTLVPRSMWSIKVPGTSAKILTLWLNSTLNLLQILLFRRETRGAYLWFVASGIRKFLVPNIDGLSKKEIDTLIQVFNKYRSERFPSLLNQLKNRFQGRVAIDKTLLKVLGFSDDNIDRILNYLYPALAKEIEQLKTLMAGK